MSAQAPSLLVVAGPTASGKSSLALALARTLDAELLSADSQQVYRGMQIGTAKPDARARAEIPHHGIDLADPGEQLSAADFVAQADLSIAEIIARKKRVIVVGGTGLWVRALLHGLLPAPPRDEALRARLEQLREIEGSPALHALLAARDPEGATRLHPNDHVRIVRALEVLTHTGETIGSRQGRHGFREQRYRARHIALRLPRDLHRARIRARTEAMFEKGWLQETRRLLEDGHRRRLEKTLGYAQCVAYLDGDLSEDDLVPRIAARTWAYARRQMTWLSKIAEVEWIDRAADETVWARRREALQEELVAWWL